MFYCVQYTKWWDRFPDPAYAGALVHRAALRLHCKCRGQILGTFIYTVFTAK